MKFNFKYPDGPEVDLFCKSYRNGYLVAMGGGSIEECPFGKPFKKQWDQLDLLKSDNPQMAGWLFGWFFGHENKFVFVNSTDDQKDAILDATELAAGFFWISEKIRKYGYEGD